MSRKKLKIKPYELSVWKEKKTNSTPYETVETRIATIGSSLMHFPGAAKNIVLKRNVNGTNTLTFQLSSRYFDAPLTYPSFDIPLKVQGGTQEFENNYFVELLHNEARLKLKYGDEWYDFLVKDIQEDSSNYLFTYTATDMYINELSRNGYNLEFSTALGNNMGTIRELGEKVLEDLDGWSLGDCDPCPEIKEEKVFKLYKFKKYDNIYTINGILSSIVSSEVFKLYNHTNKEYYTIKDTDNSGNFTAEIERVVVENGKEKTVKDVYYITGLEDSRYYSFACAPMVLENAKSFQILGFPKLNSVPDANDEGKLTSAVSFTLVYMESGTIERPVVLQGYTPDTYGPYGGYKANYYYPTVASKYDPQLETVVTQIGHHYTKGSYFKYTTPLTPGNPLWYYEKTHFQDPFPLNKLGGNENFIEGQDRKISGWRQDATTPTFTIKVDQTTKKNSLILPYENTYFNANINLLPNELGIDNYWLFFLVVKNQGTGEFSSSLKNTLSNGEFSNSPISLVLQNTTNGGTTYEKLVDFIGICDFTVGTSDSNKPFKCNIWFETTDGKIAQEKDTAIENNYFKIPWVSDTKIQYAPIPLPFTKQTDGTTGEISYNKENWIDSEIGEYIKYLFQENGNDSKIYYLFGRLDANKQETIKKMGNSLQLKMQLPQLQNISTNPLEVRQMDLFKASSKAVARDEFTINQRWCFPNQSVSEAVISAENYSYKTYHYIYYLHSKGKDPIPVEAGQSFLPPDTLYYNIKSERVTSIEIKESNRFNILQELAEKFQMWPKFTIEHDADGKILKKTISFKQSLEPDTHPLGFKYGVNLKQIQRTVNSDQLSSFVIVLPNNNEFAQNGFCTIARASQNPSGEQYIINFDYYIQMGMLDRDQVYNDLYVKTGVDGTNYIGLYPNMAEYNRKIDLYTGQIARYSEVMTNVESDMNTLKQTISGYWSKIEEIQKKIFTLFGHNAFKGNGEKVYSLWDVIKSTGDFSQQLIQSAQTIYNSITVSPLITEAKNYYKKYETASGKFDNMYQNFTQVSNRLYNFQGIIDNYVQEKKNLLQKFRKKYGRFIQEGTWQDESYIDDNQYYLDALSVAYTSSRPQISYNISAIDVSPISGYEQYDIKLGQITTIEDPKFFGYDSKGNPKKEQVFISETSECLDSPDKNEFTIQNYRTQWEDLFQRISAAVQSLQYSEAAYKKSAGIVNPFGEIKVSCLEETIKNNNLTLKNAGNQSVEWDDKGITVSSKWKSSNIVRIVNDGIYVSSDGGDNFINAVSADGISASLLTAGTVNTEEIIISANGAPSFHWDKNGLSAFWFDGTPEIFDYSKFVRFDKYGLYGIDNATPDYAPENIEKVLHDALFSLTWRGLNIKTAVDGTGCSFSTDKGLNLYDSSEPNPLIILGISPNFDIDDAITGFNYGLNGRTNSYLCFNDKEDQYLKSVVVMAKNKEALKIPIYLDGTTYAIPNYHMYGAINLFKQEITESHIKTSGSNGAPDTLENKSPMVVLNTNGIIGGRIIYSNFHNAMLMKPAVGAEEQPIYGFAHLGTANSLYGGCFQTLKLGDSSYYLPFNFVTAYDFDSSTALNLTYETKEDEENKIINKSAFGCGFGGQHLNSDTEQNFISFNGTSENEPYTYGAILHEVCRRQPTKGEYRFYSSINGTNKKMGLSGLKAEQITLENNPTSTQSKRVATLTSDKLTVEQIEIKQFSFGNCKIKKFLEIDGEERIGFFWA